MTSGEAGTGLEVSLDRRLPASTTVGSSTAALCAGTCFHPSIEVDSVWISVDGVRHSPSARQMPRPDLVEEFGPRAYRSGFWGTVPIRAPDRPGEIELRVNVRLADGRIASAPLGAMAAVERPRPIEIDRRRADGDSLIAICMTSYNPDLDLFRRQVDSIRAQTDDAWVCLISDDCSEPERFDAITATVAGDERFVVSRAEENLGFYRNFERVLAMAPPAADLIALSDHDDYWYPDKLASLRAALGGAGLAYSDARRVDSAGNVRTATLWRGRRPNHSNLASLLISNTITGAACLYRRDVIERALPFPEGPGWDFHDHWLALVALALGDIAYVDRPLYDYVQHRRAVIGRVAMNPPPNRPATRGLRHRLGVWRSAYFTRYLQLELHATVLLTRCGAELTSRKRRAIRLVLQAPRSPLAFAWLAVRPARAVVGRNETLGTEGIFVRGILWRFLVALHAFGRGKPGGLADQLSVPSFEVRTHKLGTRVRRWISHTDHRDAGDRSSHA